MATKNYVLKRGMKHSFIKDGERKKIVGDGKLTVPLTEGQAKNFRDKFVMKDDDELVTQDAVDATVSGEPKNGASGGASAASQGTLQPASKEDAKVVESNTKGDDKPAEKPASDKK